MLRFRDAAHRAHELPQQVEESRPGSVKEQAQDLAPVPAPLVCESVGPHTQNLRIRPLEDALPERIHETPVDRHRRQAFEDAFELSQIHDGRRRRDGKHIHLPLVAPLQRPVAVADHPLD